MHLAIVITRKEAEAVFNALRLANLSRDENDRVSIFLLGEGVELDRIKDPIFDVREQYDRFIAGNGKILACTTCLALRKSDGSGMFVISTLKDLHTMIKDADRVMTF